jgi:DnaJ-class molecular chaperone
MTAKNIEPWFDAPRRTCPNCQGYGRIRDSMRVDSVPCIRCDGRGVIPDEAANSQTRGEE